VRWLSWLLRQVRYGALAPVPETIPGSLNPSLGRGSADDCEAFLAGRLAEYRMDHHHYVSVSDWTNLLAHGSEADLKSEIAEANERRPRNGKARGDAEWREARGYLAATLLHRATDEGALQRIQRLVLVPLELELAAGAMAWGPRRWVTEVEGAVTRHQRAQGPSDHREPHPPT
jgi:hypothetical protein